MLRHASAVSGQNADFEPSRPRSRSLEVAEMLRRITMLQEASLQLLHGWGTTLLLHLKGNRLVCSIPCEFRFSARFSSKPHNTPGESSTKPQESVKMLKLLAESQLKKACSRLARPAMPRSQRTMRKAPVSIVHSARSTQAHEL